MVGFKGQEKLWLIGVDTAKSTIYPMLRNPTPGPGYIDFPTNPGGEDDNGIGAEYFQQLTSERRITDRKGGRLVQRWILPAGKRNKALDCTVLYCQINFLRRSLPLIMAASDGLRDLKYLSEGRIYRTIWML
jgi:phage terminase large subunit GpA-like protein